MEVVYYRHFAPHREAYESIDEALDQIQLAENYGNWATVGIYLNGEPHIWDGYVDRDTPTPEQADEMREEYAKAKEA